MGTGLFFLFLGLLLLFLQSHPMLPFARGGIRPDLVLLLVVYVGTVRDLCKGAFLVFLLGCCVAPLSGGPAGMYALVYLVVFLFIQMLRRFFFFKELPIITLLATLCCLLEALLLATAFRAIHPADMVITMKTVLRNQVAFTIALAPIILVALQLLHKLFTVRTRSNLSLILQYVWRFPGG